MLAGGGCVRGGARQHAQRGAVRRCVGAGVHVLWDGRGGVSLLCRFSPLDSTTDPGQFCLHAPCPPLQATCRACASLPTASPPLCAGWTFPRLPCGRPPSNACWPACASSARPPPPPVAPQRRGTARAAPARPALPSRRRWLRRWLRRRRRSPRWPWRRRASYTRSPGARWVRVPSTPPAGERLQEARRQRWGGGGLGLRACLSDHSMPLLIRMRLPLGVAVETLQASVAKPDHLIDVSDLDPALPRCAPGRAVRCWMCLSLARSMHRRLLPRKQRGAAVQSLPHQPIR